MPPFPLSDSLVLPFWLSLTGLPGSLSLSLSLSSSSLALPLSVSLPPWFSLPGSPSRAAGWLLPLPLAPRPPRWLALPLALRRRRAVVDARTSEGAARVRTRGSALREHAPWVAGSPNPPALSSRRRAGAPSLPLPPAPLPPPFFADRRVARGTSGLRLIKPRPTRPRRVGDGRVRASAGRRRPLYQANNSPLSFALLRACLRAPPPPLPLLRSSLLRSPQLQYLAVMAQALLIFST